LITVAGCGDRLRRLYRSIEDGIVELDDIPHEHTTAVMSQRDQAKATLDRARSCSSERGSNLDFFPIEKQRIVLLIQCHRRDLLKLAFMDAVAESKVIALLLPIT
jgi:hypothetical protein